MHYPKKRYRCEGYGFQAVYSGIENGYSRMGGGGQDWGV